EHGETQLPFWSATHIAGKNISEYFNDPAYGITEADKLSIVENVKSAGAGIIKNKGATYYAIAVSVNTLLESLLKNQNTIRTVSSVIDNKFGIDDVALSLPSVLNQNGVKKVMDLNMTDEELSLLHHSADQLKLILEEVKDI
ncbi:MAG: L-lactate dehydrogenase, partial [Acetivibrionales bacterium]